MITRLSVREQAVYFEALAKFRLDGSMPLEELDVVGSADWMVAEIEDGVMMSPANFRQILKLAGAAGDKELVLIGIMSSNRMELKFQPDDEQFTKAVFSDSGVFAHGDSVLLAPSMSWVVLLRGGHSAVASASSRLCLGNTLNWAPQS